MKRHLPVLHAGEYVSPSGARRPSAKRLLRLVDSLPDYAPLAPVVALPVRTRVRPEPAPAAPEPEEIPLSREQRRSRRKHAVRAETLHWAGRGARWAVKRGQAEYEENLAAFGGVHPPLPATRAECPDPALPCPFASCRFHMKFDISPRTGTIKDNFPGLEIWEMKDTCVLRLADQGPQTLERIGEAMNLTRERVRQLEHKAYAKLEDGWQTAIAYESLPEDEASPRRPPRGPVRIPYAGGGTLEDMVELPGGEEA